MKANVMELWALFAKQRIRKKWWPSLQGSRAKVTQYGSTFSSQTRQNSQDKLYTVQI